MKLIIGCGYLGSRVGALWRADGQRVLATTRSRHAELSALGLEPVRCDVLDPESCKTLPEVKTVLHCVGFDRRGGASMRDVYVRGLENVLAGLPKPGRFLYVSSTSVYGQSGGEEVDEDSATEPGSDNGRIVLEAEQVLRRICPDAVILRFAGIYGPGRNVARQNIEKGLPLEGDPERWLNLIHVDDGAAAILAAEKHAWPGEIYNVSDGHPARRREYFEHLAKVLGLPAPRFCPVTQEGGPNRRIGNRRMCQELGFSPRFKCYKDGLSYTPAPPRLECP